MTDVDMIVKYLQKLTDESMEGRKGQFRRDPIAYDLHTEYINIYSGLIHVIKSGEYKK